MLGTVLGVGALVAVLGLTTTAAGQISERFTVLAATEVTVEQTANAAQEYTAGTTGYNAFPDDASARIEDLNGVRHAGVWWTLETEGGDGIVSALPPGSANAPIEDLTIYAAAPGALEASRPTYSVGRGFDTFHDTRAEQVALLGSSAARRLGISRLDGHPAVFIDDRPFTIIGIIDDLDRNTEYLLGVVVPAATAERLW